MLETAILLCVAAALYYLHHLPTYYLNARKIGLPIVVVPVSHSNPLWIVFSATFEPQLRKYLPSWLYNRIKLTIHGWEFRDRWQVNAKLGPSFVLVNPSGIELVVADPDVAQQVLVRRNDFLQMPISSQIMSFFGPNITAVSSLHVQEIVRSR